MAKAKAAPKRWQLIAELEEIRTTALDAIRVPGKALKDPWALFGALKRLRRFDYKPEYMQAKVAICVAGRIRPKVAFRTLKLLRAQQKKDGTLEEFDVFCDALDAHMAPAMLTQHGFAEVSLGTASHEALWSDIARVRKDLSKLGHDSFLNSGTLLGVTRDGELIGHDDDVDLAVVLKARSAKAAAKEWTALAQKLMDQGMLWADAANLEILKVRSDEGIMIDLFPAWSQRGQMHIYPYSQGDLKREDVLPLRKCKISKQAIPANPKRVLEVNYGDNWQTPDRLFRFGWAEARLRFADFLSDVRRNRSDAPQAEQKAKSPQTKAA